MSRQQRRYLVKRLALSLFSLWVVATFLFLAFRLLPGDPTTAVIAPEMSASARQELAAQYGLDKPLYVQYGLFLRNLLVGNLGVSFQFNEPVSQLIVEKLVNTLALTATSVVLAYAIGSLLGAFLASKRDTAVDVYGTGLTLVMYAAPVFWTGMLAIMVFSFRLGWLPSGGIHSVTFVADSFWGSYLSVDFLYHLILPVTVTTLYFLSVPALTMRNNMIDVLDRDFIQLSRAAGLSRRSILYRHAARNALLPVLHYAAVSLGFAFGGSVVIETVFSWPGLGKLMFDATLAQDFPLAQSTFLLLAAVIILMNFLADALSVYVDPRAALTE
jgi:peptide/nickel transport system permease protein